MSPRLPTAAARRIQVISRQKMSSVSVEPTGSKTGAGQRRADAVRLPLCADAASRGRRGCGRKGCVLASVMLPPGRGADVEHEDRRREVLPGA